MKMLIVVDGGMIQNIIATDEVSIYIVDHDDLRIEKGFLFEARQAQQPDCICDDENFDRCLDEALEEYNDMETMNNASDMREKQEAEE